MSATSLGRRRMVAAASLLAVLILAGAAAARPAALHYQVNLKLDPAHGALAADVAITVPASQAKTGASFLLARGYRVLSVAASANASASVADADVPFPGLQKLVLGPAARGASVLRVTYAGPLSATGEPPINTISPERLELSADSLWYPLSVDFNTRFSLDARITGLGRGFVVASPDEVRMRRDGFELHRVRPSQDIAFTASPDFKTANVGALQFFARDLQSEQARNYLVYGPRALAYFESWFGPLPRRRAVIAIVERKNGTGYSRPGYLVVADVGALAADNVWGRVGYVAHELSHGWWSNADFTGEDYWLVESTAEYSALRFLEVELGPEALAGQLDRKKDRAARAGPILGHGRPSDAAVYAKGPLLLFALEKSIGRAKLDRVLGVLARRDVITTRDFLEALTKVAGPDAARDFEAKLRS